jgi:hypothetical protein
MAGFVLITNIVLNGRSAIAHHYDERLSSINAGRRTASRSARRLADHSHRHEERAARISRVGSMQNLVTLQPTAATTSAN